MVKDFPSLTVEAGSSAMGQVSSDAAAAVATSEAVDRQDAEGT
jgi:hypothetical protein